MILCYGCLVFGASSTTKYYMTELDKFDIDGNGWFTPDEQTPEQDQAMHRLTNDMEEY